MTVMQFYNKERLQRYIGGKAGVDYESLRYKDEHQNEVGIEDHRSVIFGNTIGKKVCMNTQDHRSAIGNGKTATDDGRNKRRLMQARLLFDNVYTTNKKEKVIAPIDGLISNKRRAKEIQTSCIPLLRAGVCWGTCISPMFSLLLG